ncbi:hypothetical protein BDN72DRAFT_161933 [Pluteus cervinus]|uniref:Uncharacterized protein n=1 Tax=Pluteus cervinus TaxID=181527 RepID=A0ACD2ZX45_9AGAR|nr:hypothetical protein BDN72DRAFT_161933 [Pluteus cervinus]
MLFRPLWRKWTLNLLNSQLSTLTISTNCTSQEVWHNTLPNICLPALKYFGITDQNVSLNDLGIFLQQHSSTLSWINLLIQDSSQLVESDGQTSHNRIFAKRRVAFNFPNAEQLTLTPLCVQWLLRGVIYFSAPTGKNGFKQSEPLTPHNYLPKLKSLTITLPYLRADEWAPDFFSQLDKALPTLAEFAKLGPPRDRDPSPSPVSRMNDQGRVEDWFSSLTINAMVVEPDLEQPNIDWFNLHASKGPASPLLALHTVSNLHLNYIITKPEGFHALPKFLALFKGLKRVDVLLQSRKVLKKMDTDFWKGFKQDCPGLETLQFQIAATILQVTMEDLVKGTAAL